MTVRKPAKRPGTGKGRKKGQRPTRYTDFDRSAALIALDRNGGRIMDTAEELGIPYNTLQAWAAGSRHPEARIIQKRHKGDMLAAFREAAWQYLDVATDPEKIQKAPLAQVIAGLDKTFGIMRTLEGKPSGITGSVETRLNLSILTEHELNVFLALMGKLQSANPDPRGPVGVGPSVLPPVRAPVLRSDEPGPDVHPGPGDGRDSGSLTSGS